MAECSLATLRGQHRGRWIQSNSKLSPRNMSIRMPKRDCPLKIHLPCKSRAATEWKSVAFTPFGSHGRDHRVKTSVKCYCLKPLMDFESMVSTNLMLISDETLLTISMVFAYLAGVVPSGQTSPRARNQGVNQQITGPSSSDSGRDIKFLPERNAGFDPSDMWSEVSAKLSEALQANVQDANLDGREDEPTSDRKNYPLSMLAIHGGPRLRLLLITFQLLEMEVRNISRSPDLVDGIRWVQVTTTLIDGLIQPAFLKWIEEEQILENGQTNDKLMKMIDSKIKDDGRISKRFNRFGKSELYLDLLFFLRFGSARSGSYFDAKFLAEHGARILEDLVISLADVTASIYLELMSVDGDMSTEVVSSSLALCSLSTRELQKLRNEVAIKWWLHQYFESVVSMYEDRFELYVLCRKKCEKTADNQAEKTNWWRLAFGKPSVPTLLNYVNISPFSLPARRTKELRALMGWRYYFSLFLELSDIAMPFLRVAVSKVSAAVSYFWVSMIGRSLGLIFSGIRQSLGWR
uniref:Regulator receiver domain-like 1 n=1 Tax=Echinochloa crus-galli TaxID=90397 RepID=A0A219LLI6_ECHCG|nr:regulator receiver domain-like 1 [Echinochloa crus-galli]